MGIKCTALIMIAILLVALAVPADADPTPPQVSTQGSGNSGDELPARVVPHRAAPGESKLTFDELPIDTPVDVQYVLDGIAFGGDSPYITDDPSNPTSPVLSGTPRFTGSIVAAFVTVRGRPRTVDRFSLDVGYINNPGSVAVTAYDSQGKVLKTSTADKTGIVPIAIKAKGIGYFSVGSVAGEDAGFAIDNVIFPSTVNLVALGDSYSSGEGNEPFDKGTKNHCRRSSKAWPRVVAANSTSIVMQKHIACSGALLSALTSQFNGEQAQISQVKALPGPPEVITMTIGGNDVGFADILWNCYSTNPSRHKKKGKVPKEPTCVTNKRLSKAKKAMDDLKPKLTSSYKKVQAAAPSAAVVIVGYPRLFPRSQDKVKGCSWLQNDERNELNELAKHFDGVISAAAKEAKVLFVSVRSNLDGHELCSKDSWVHPLDWFGDKLRGHPTEKGQKAMAGVVGNFLFDHGY